MATDRTKQRKEAKSLYIKSKGQMSAGAIAKKLGVPPSTVYGWKKKDQWDKSLKGKARAAKKKKPAKAGAPEGNRNAEGAGAPEGNRNAKYRHGLYSQLLPAELHKIIDEIEALQLSPKEILYNNIMILYAKIIRFINITHVQDATDETIHIKGVKGSGIEEMLRYISKLNKNQDDTQNEDISTHVREQQRDGTPKRPIFIERVSLGYMTAHEKEVTSMTAYVRACGELRMMLRDYVMMNAYERKGDYETARTKKIVADTDRQKPVDPNEAMAIMTARFNALLGMEDIADTGRGEGQVEYVPASKPKPKAKRKPKPKG